MKCVVIGAGNAGRPVARILNYIGHQVHITDQKRLDEFAPKYQEILLQMEEEGVKLNLGNDVPQDMASFDSAYLSPNIAADSLVWNQVGESGMKLLEHREVSHIVDDLIDIDIIGVTGTLGKTSTTHIIAQIFESSGYDVWKCSSRHGNLLSEVIVDGIIKDHHRKCDEGRFAQKFHEENGYWPPSVQTAMERYTKSLAAARLHKEGIETVPLYSSDSDPFEAVTYKAGGEQLTWAEEISTLRRAQNESQRVFEQRTKAITSDVLRKKISKMQTQNLMLFELELKELTLEAI